MIVSWLMRHEVALASGKANNDRLSGAKAKTGWAS